MGFSLAHFFFSAVYFRFFFNRKLINHCKFTALVGTLLKIDFKNFNLCTWGVTKYLKQKQKRILHAKGDC